MIEDGISACIPVCRNKRWHPLQGDTGPADEAPEDELISGALTSSDMRFREVLQSFKESRDDMHHLAYAR
jgi:hypothetical protein